MGIEQFTFEFESARPRLKSFLLRLTASVQDAEDIVQDTFIRASSRLDTFRGESSLKTWIFAIANNLAKDNLRVQTRWTENATDITKEAALGSKDFFSEAMHIAATSPQGQFEIKEHISLCLTCITKSLPLEQQICLFLKEIYEFKTSEITQILDTTEAMVKYYLHSARSKMTAVFESRCSLINKNGVCHQCSELNGIFNPKQNFEEEKNKIEFARKANDPDRSHLLDLRFKILSEIDPFNSQGATLQLHHLAFNRTVMENYREKVEE
jgi:RNA polymerase sigma-70 factor (ECF subfamily)